MTAESAFRWGSLVVALAALAWLAVELGASIAPIAAALVVLVAAGVLAAVLWRRHLDEQAVRA